MRLGAALARLLPLLAVVAFAGGLLVTLAVAGDTLGYDFRAYHAAAVRVLDGRAAYDTSYESAGGFGLFYYPPTFIPLVLALGLLPEGAATWAWVAGLVAAFVAGVALIPVRPTVRWLVLLLAGVSWPFVYAVKLGQVGPVLFLLFAAGWRWMDRPAVLGAAGALGAAIKIQPALMLGWALLTRRWAAFAWGIAVLGGLGIAATLAAGPAAWSDFLGLIARVSDPITTAHNFTPGAVAYRLGLSREAAAALQWVSMGAALVAVVVSALRLRPVPSYLVALVASQLLSPILWDHYALLLLLPVAWLVDRGQRWAVVFVLATPLLLVDVVPPWVYPAAMWGCLAAVAVVGGAADRTRAPLAVAPL